MPRVFRPLTLLLVCTYLIACASTPGEAGSSVQPTDHYDNDLATKLGADDYGMRSYVLVILKTGPARITDEARRKELFAGHFSNMSTLAEQQQLVLAGPLVDGGDKRGLYIFNVSTLEDAKSLVLTDPAVAAGIFTAEFTKYYGSAALMQINDVHKSIQKIAIE